MPLAMFCTWESKSGHRWLLYPWPQERLLTHQDYQGSFPFPAPRYSSLTGFSPPTLTSEAHLILKSKAVWQHGGHGIISPSEPEHPGALWEQPPGPGRQLGHPQGRCAPGRLFPLKHAADTKPKTHTETSPRCHSHRCSGCGIAAGGGHRGPAGPTARNRHQRPRPAAPPGPLPSQSRPPPRPRLTFPGGPPAPTSPPASGS